MLKSASLFSLRLFTWWVCVGACKISQWDVLGVSQVSLPVLILCPYIENVDIIVPLDQIVCLGYLDACVIALALGSHVLVRAPACC